MPVFRGQGTKIGRFGTFRSARSAPRFTVNQTGQRVFRDVASAFGGGQRTIGRGRFGSRAAPLSEDEFSPKVGEEFFIGEDSFIRTDPGFIGLSPEERAGFIPPDQNNLELFFGLKKADELRASAGTPKGRGGRGRALLIGGSAGGSSGTSGRKNRDLAATVQRDERHVGGTPGTLG